MRRNLKIFSVIIIMLYFSSLFLPIKHNLDRTYISIIFGILVVPLAVYEMIMLYKDDKKNNTKTFQNRLIWMTIGTIILILNLIYWNTVEKP